MTDTASDPLRFLTDLATPDEARRLAAEGVAPARPPAVNSHIHLPPNFSAFDSVAQAVELADAQDVRVLGVSNYYDYRVYADFVALARPRGIFPLFGLEIICLIDELVADGLKINDPGNPGKMYVCGKAVTRFADMTDTARRIVEKIRAGDRDRMAEMIAALAGLFADAGVETPLTEPAVIDGVVARHECPPEAVTLQERHVARAFQEALFAATSADRRPAVLAELLGAAPPDVNDPVAVQGAIRKHLMKAGKPAFVAERFVDFDEAYTLICELGGIPCYPTLADGASPICPFEQPVETLIAELKDRNIHAAEFIPVRNEPDVLAEYVTAMRRAGIFVTAGTEHNTLDLLPIEPTCVGGKPVPDELKDIFREGACVAAAHEFLTVSGEPGFVDAEGRPNPDYDSDESRITDFARLGAAVIERYFHRTAR